VLSPQLSIKTFLKATLLITKWNR